MHLAVWISLAIALALAVALVAAGVWVIAKRRRLAAALPEPAEGATRHPVVLVHGILGFDEIGALGVRQDYFRGVVAHLEGRGITVYRPRMAPTAAVPERARQLAAFVSTLPHAKVNIIAHSMGGLDARYAIARLGIADRIASLVTLGTPHRGTPIADLSEGRTARLARGLARRLGIDVDGFAWLTRERLARFNADVPDHPDVFYACVPCTVTNGTPLNPLLAPTQSYLRRRHGDNDGLVTEASQLWGRPLFTASADHWAQVGWSLGYPVAALYDQIVQELRMRGL